MKAIRPIKKIKAFATSKFVRKFGKKTIKCTDTGEVVRSYDAYLRSKHWKQFKARYKKSEYYRGKCLLCPATTRLHYHHITYKNIGDESFEDVVELCRNHHKQIHNVLNRGVSWDYIIKQLQNL